MPDRKPRLSIEVQPTEEPLIRHIRAAAALRGVNLREWVLEALREKYEREQGSN
ncbi:MAG TPA: hypothetical protein VNM48_03550 [Chloroflexota bacterium]|nr:hypothetical protein [Chloroflexota bacterium]